MSEELKETVENTVDEKPAKKETKKKSKVILVTKTSVVYDDDGEIKFMDKNAFESVKVGDLI